MSLFENLKLKNYKGIKNRIQINMTRFNKDITKEQLEKEIVYIQYLIYNIERQGLKDEQFFLDFLDELNILSVQY